MPSPRGATARNSDHGRCRSDDLRFFRPALYQLSYAIVCHGLDSNQQQRALEARASANWTTVASKRGRRESNPHLAVLETAALVQLSYFPVAEGPRRPSGGVSPGPPDVPHTTRVLLWAV